MKRALYTDCAIAASAELVWEKLQQLDSYSEWNTLFQLTGGEVEEDEAIRIRLTAPGVWELFLHGRIIEFYPSEQLTWKFHLGIPGILDGVHSFELQPIEKDRIQFIQKLRFTGLLSKYFFRRFQYNLARGMESMNMGLTDLAEASPDPSKE